MKFWHQHGWKVTGAQQMESVHSMIVAAHTVRSPITEVLMVCDCGQLKTITLDGHWTVQQLQPAPTKADADREFFRKLGVKL